MNIAVVIDFTTTLKINYQNQSIKPDEHSRAY